MKNESLNIDEWISHYLTVGADRIVLVDNGSTDDTVSKAEAWVRNGNVDLMVRPEPYRQAAHYWEAARRFILGKYEWLAIADLDEFWFCPDGSTLATKLDDPMFARTDVIYANWFNFGSSGLVRHPQSVRKSFVHRDPHIAEHINSKYICRTQVLRSRRSIGVHKVFGADSSRTVSDNSAFHLFHYPIQSLEFFQTVKMSRGDATSAHLDTARDMDYFLNRDALSTLEDNTLAKLVEENRLGSI